MCKSHVHVFNVSHLFARIHNKGVYVRLGMSRIGRRTSCKELNKELKIEVDGNAVTLPTLEGILILNISR